MSIYFTITSLFKKFQTDEKKKILRIDSNDPNIVGTKSILENMVKKKRQRKQQKNKPNFMKNNIFNVCFIVCLVYSL